MKCAAFRESFSDHLDGALSLDDEGALARHLQACVDCREALGRYETSLATLAGLQPEPPADLAERATRMLASRGLLRRRPTPRTWLSLAAALAIFAIGVIVGRVSTDRRPTEWGSAPAAAWQDACVGPGGPPLEGSVLLAAPVSPPEPHRFTVGPYVLHLPAWLTSRSPYRPEPAAAVVTGAQACLPLQEPLGGRLALTLTPATGPRESQAGRFVVEVASDRVLYARVRWRQAGLMWSLEGRAEPSELLEVARQLSAHVEVERTGAPDPPV